MQRSTDARDPLPAGATRRGARAIWKKDGRKGPRNQFVAIMVVNSRKTKILAYVIVQSGPFYNAQQNGSFRSRLP